MAKSTDSDELRLSICKRTIKPGDQVCLISGGPMMTVEGWREDFIIKVKWFVDGHLQRDAFHPFELELRR